jgi:ribosomal-protein-alanine N-acetyltransferase
VNPNLEMRRFEDSDIDDIFEFLKDELAVKYTPYNSVMCIEDTKKILEKWKNKKNVFAVLNEGKVIGCAMLFEKTKDTTEFGFMFNRKYWGMGIGTNISRWLIFVAKKQGYKFIISTVNKENKSSVSIMKRLNMKLQKSDGDLNYYEKTIFE